MLPTLIAEEVRGSWRPPRAHTSNRWVSVGFLLSPFGQRRPHGKPRVESLLTAPISFLSLFGSWSDWAHLVAMFQQSSSAGGAPAGTLPTGLNKPTQGRVPHCFLGLGTP